MFSVFISDYTAVVHVPYPAQMRVGDTPTIFYVPDFISEADEQELMARTYAADADADAGASNGWVSLRSRRLKCWGGQPGEDFRPEPLPPWVGALCDSLVARGVFSEEERPNHVLLNGEEERRGQVGDGSPRDTEFRSLKSMMLHQSTALLCSATLAPLRPRPTRPTLLTQERSVHPHVRADPIFCPNIPRLSFSRVSTGPGNHGPHRRAVLPAAHRHPQPGERRCHALLPPVGSRRRRAAGSGKPAAGVSGAEEAVPGGLRRRRLLQSVAWNRRGQ